MQLDPEYLRQHYASLSDEALLAVDRADLVETAQTVFDLEVGRRKLQSAVPTRPDSLEEDPGADEAEFDGETHGAGAEPGWLEEAAEIHSWAVKSATEDAPAAAIARDELEAAGIPCYLELCEIPPEKSLLPYGTHRWRLMVPGAVSMRAISVLERALFNPEFEAGWKAHLETLSDEELRALNPQAALCGLFDRIARVNRAYDEEVARRKLK